MIKYLGSKRALVPALTKLAEASGARTALDLFTGTTRVAQSLKRLGMIVTANDLASYSYVMSKTWIELDSNSANLPELQGAIDRLNQLPGVPGYFTQTFCDESRFFQPKNGAKVDVIRATIEADYRNCWLYYPLLTSLILAADRVDSTTGQQMAFLKNWAARSFADLELRPVELLPGSGKALQGDALEVAKQLPTCDLAYLDPPYNQHRYFANYHIWETLVRGDEPDSYGIAKKRLDVRSEATKSAYNSKRTMPNELKNLVRTVAADTLVLSYNNESWLDLDELIEICEQRGKVQVLQFDYRRYVGSKIGVYNKKGEVVGEPTHHRNIEYVVLAGTPTVVDRMVESLS